jgi:hypothetical protein
MKIRYDDDGNIVEWGENLQGDKIINNVSDDLSHYISICGKVIDGNLIIDENMLMVLKSSQGLL